MEKGIREKVGRAIQEARKAKGLTQQELANSLGVGQAVVNRYEAGKQNLTIETIQKISTILESPLLIEFKP